MVVFALSGLAGSQPRSGRVLPARFAQSPSTLEEEAIEGLGVDVESDRCRG
jgi:hypothetical protein